MFTVPNPNAPQPYSDGVVRLSPQAPDPNQQYGVYHHEPATAPPQSIPEESSRPRWEEPRRSSKHVIYSIEILIFSLVGCGWLAVREFMGATPVMDVSVLLCLLISSAVNLALALIYYTTDQFGAAAQGFFGHTLSIWVLYVYSLAESTTGGWGPLCCEGELSSGSAFSVTKTYAAAYFGGLPFHQTAGAVTLSFLSVVLILAAGQVRVCLEDPREWLAVNITTSVSCLISFHVGLFALNSKVCGGSELGGTVIVIAGLAIMLSADISGVLLCIPHAGRVLIQRGAELTLTALLSAWAGVLSFQIGGGVSLALIIIFGGIALWQAVALGGAMVALRRGDQHLSLAPAEDTLSPLRVSSRFSGAAHHGRPTMLMPGVGDTSLHGRRREKKAW